MGKLSESFLKVITNKMQREDALYYAQKKEVEDVYEQNDIAYMEGQCMDLHRPKTVEEKQFYIVDIHGGGWVYGDKKLNRHFCMHLASYGYPVYNLNYGLAPTYCVKQQVQQIITALQFMQTHNDTYGVKSYKLCLCGDSAGAHLASLIACITKDEKLQTLYEVDTSNIHIHALLLQHGIYDLQPMRTSNKGYMKALYQWMFPKQDALLKGKDCLYPYLSAAWDIPMFLLSSKGDTMFCIQTQMLIERLKQLQIKHDSLLWEQDDLQHVFHISFPDKEESKISFQQMANFLANL